PAGSRFEWSPLLESLLQDEVCRVLSRDCTVRLTLETFTRKKPQRAFVNRFHIGIYLSCSSADKQFLRGHPEHFLAQPIAPEQRRHIDRDHGATFVQFITN